jgi:hypothetical protein
VDKNNRINSIFEIIGGNQIFEYSKSHNLIAGLLCLDTNGSPGVVKMNNCNKNLKSQQWDYDNIVIILRIYILKSTELLTY